ncbi:Sec-independent protein translocase subunit TatA [Pantoea sp. Aalb]|uniref:Sec-independent protein translocase subunit TatA n=1 Tax=Pantoea sp. Aalb TaxID=2576762 RepID=UPI001324FDC4|nr:Sec-independent protein translocase subunit TatA [Pantoea sp. Aalb]MXP67558.1 twin-arginine translocase TatA/TatE family subunit [Pantoea sp. Aalb]
MEGITISKLLIIGALIILLFGSNKLRSLGNDLGSAIKGFKNAMKDKDDDEDSIAVKKISKTKLPSEDMNQHPYQDKDKKS